MSSADLQDDTHIIDINGRPAPVRIRLNPRASRVILRLDQKSRQFILVLPTARSRKAALDFADTQKDWIEQRLAELPAPVTFVPGAVFPLQGRDCRITHAPCGRGGVWVQEPGILCVSGREEHVPRRVRDWLRQQSKTRLAERCLAHSNELALRPARVTVRDTISRWGSCSHTGALSFSWRLILAPEDILDYVAAHETAHRLHMNHGKSFWRVVDRLVPFRHHAEDWLSNKGHELYRYGG